MRLHFYRLSHGTQQRWVVSLQELDLKPLTARVLRSLEGWKLQDENAFIYFVEAFCAETGSQRLECAEYTDIAEAYMRELVRRRES